MILFFLTLSIWSQSASALFKKATDEYLIGNYLSATNYCKQSIQKNNKTNEVNFIAGLAFYNLKDTLNAITYFSNETQINKTDYRSFLYKAKLNTKYFDSANSDLKKAIELQPENFVLYLEKGNLNYYHLKYSEAIDEYNKAISLNPNLDDAYYKLGFCKLYLNDTINACDNWNKIEELDDFNEYEFIKTICNKK
jgi:tetratricopeptide (TPR) repeat protein